MLLEFKSKEAALKAFSLSDINIDMFKNHVLFDGCEIHRHPGSDPFIIVFYSSGLEGCYSSPASTPRRCETPYYPAPGYASRRDLASAVHNR